jgi:hypothetical protein
MDRTSVPALRERLGDQALGELVEMVNDAGRVWRDDVLELATERFGRMLAEEAGKLRVEIANLRAELKGDIAGLRTELKGDGAGLRADLLKWSFAFWVGQVVAMIGVLAFMLQGAR